MSSFLNQGNENKNETGVEHTNNYNEMGVDVGEHPDNASLCVHSSSTDNPSKAAASNSSCGPCVEHESLEISSSIQANSKISLQDAAATDSGRESVNEFDSSLEDAQLSKKPCTVDFYASNGGASQTTWYLKPDDATATQEFTSVATDEIPATVMALEDVANAKMDAEANVLSGERRSWHTECSSENSPFSSNTPNTITATSAKGNDSSINVIRIREDYNGDYQRTPAFLMNLGQQLRAVSSPSLTESTPDATITTPAASLATTTATKTTIVLPRIDVECDPINYSATSPSSASSASHRTAAAATQNIGVLQKFKRTFSHFNGSQQQQQQQQLPTHNHTPPTSSSAILPVTSSQSEGAAESGRGGGEGGEGGGGGIAFNTNSSNSNVIMEPTQTAEQSSSTGSKYRFGPLIWRSSKERRKTKHNRRDKCNSGDSGIQIELDNDEHFARVLGGTQCPPAAGLGDGRDVNGRGSLEDTISSSQKYRIRRANSAKAATTTTTATSNTAGGDGDGVVYIANSALASTTSSTQSVKAKVLRKMDGCDYRAAPASIPARSLSQPTGLDRLTAPQTRTNAADLDESDTDSVSSSHPDYNEVNHHRPLYAEVLYNFTSAGPQELSLERGSLVEILRKEIGPWWYGRKKNDGVVDTLFEPQLGWFPKDFVRILQFPETSGYYTATQQQQQQQQQQRQQQLHTTYAKLKSPSLNETLINDAGSEMRIDNSNKNNVTTIIIDPAPEINSPVKRTTSAYCHSDPDNNDGDVMLPQSKSINVLHDNSNIMRNNAVRELYDTEVNYVKLLAAICRGYLPAMSKRIDIFTPDSLRLIFSNIESIFKFQQQFLEALRVGIERNSVAQVFMDHQSGFLVYSTYCNSYPRALIELESYSRNKDARTVMENCRLAENLPELPLSAHLLAPIQRICRYPLHLAELIKNSFSRASDASAEQSAALEAMDEIDASLYEALDTKESLEIALKAMKNVTEAVNEGKRHSENLARHQSNFENFSGPPLHFHSTRYFMQIDATRVSPNLWNNTYTLFLFDRQLIYCKKDILKRQHFIYKGRIFLDSCRILNLPDGKIFGATVKNALRIYCDTRNKWFDFSFRSANRKRRFLTTLALERQFCGKNLFISELAGDETTDDRNLSDREYHSDYETAAVKSAVGSGEGGGIAGGGLLRGAEIACSTINIHCKEENIYDALPAVNSSSGGSSSVPESPAKQQLQFCDTLPKKSQRQANASTLTTATPATNGGKDSHCDYNTSSLGRRKLGNFWFRKSKSTNSTPNQSPTHQPQAAPGIMLQLNSDSSSLSSPALSGGKSKELTSSSSS